VVQRFLFGVELALDGTIALVAVVIAGLSCKWRRMLLGGSAESRESSA
jgi:hypothetical protein